MKRQFLCLIICLAALSAWGQSDSRARYDNNYEKAKRGDVKAQNECGEALKETGMYAEECISWFRKAAEKGYAPAQYNLGVLYAGGYYPKALPQDRKQAFYWYMKAAEQGYAPAQCSVGYFYYFGTLGEKDYVQAAVWLRKAAEQGDPDAQNRLGIMCYNGLGVEKNLVQAAYWYKKSAEQEWFSRNSAQKNLAKVEEELRSQNSVANNNQQNTVPTQQSVVSKPVQQQPVQSKPIQTQPAKQLAETQPIKQQPMQTQPVKQLASPTQTVNNSSVDKNIPSTNFVNENTFAVIIGNEKYRNESEVPYAENDAQMFKEYVQHTLGVPEKQIRLVKNAGLNDLRGAVRWLTIAMDVSGGQGRAIFYYAGHGIPNEAEKSAYMLPVDGYGNDVESGYSMGRLYEELGKMQAQCVTVFIDACFSGAKREGGMMVSSRGIAYAPKPLTPIGNTVAFTATQGDETAFPYKEKQHGMFTYFLLKKLQETRGNITLGELSDYLLKEVKRQSFVENNKVQTPTVSPSKVWGTNWKDLKLK